MVTYHMTRPFPFTSVTAEELATDDVTVSAPWTWFLAGAPPRPFFAPPLALEETRYVHVHSPRFDCDCWAWVYHCERQGPDLKMLRQYDFEVTPPGQGWNESIAGGCRKNIPY